MRDNGVSSYRRYLNGDKKALEEIVAAYSDSLVRYIFCFVKNSAWAEDIMEETIASLIVKRKKFSENAAFEAYLFRIARNKSFDYLRSPANRISAIDDYENVLHGEDAEREIFKREQRGQLYVCLSKLKAEYRDVLYLIYFVGFSAEEVQKCLKKNRKQVYNLLSRAKSSLKEALLKEGFEYEEL